MIITLITLKNIIALVLGAKQVSTGSKDTHTITHHNREEMSFDCEWVLIFVKFLLLLHVLEISLFLLFEL